MKIAFIGAGSVGFTRKMVSDILSVPALQNIEIALMDIDPINLEMIYNILDRDIKANGLTNVRLTKTTDRRESLRDAKYIFTFIRVGGLEAFATDVEIPLKYGVDQCVGDTLCAGGIMYGQRTIPVILDICKDIREVSAPDALFLNYSNPNAMNTWAANTYGGVKTLGLCQGVQHGHEQLANVLGLPMNEVDIICAGINHQTWYLEVKHHGKDMRGKLLEAFKNHPVYSKQEKVRIDILERFGYYSTESNGHLSEYLAWYRKRPNEIDQWIDYSEWIHGESGGYLRFCRELREKFDEEAKQYQTMKPNVYDGTKRSLEHASYIIEALETGRMYRGHFNVINKGAISNLPADSVVEVPGYVDGNGISIPLVGDLPAPCAAICNQSIAVQRLSVEAAVEGNPQKLKQAMLLDPLVGAVCNPPEVWAMADEMLKAQAKWLPQYKK
ncbi:MAG: alpha-glucosidase/alpha-galactosidase [Treponema sp.]|jgi:alpha-galactosidase|nr:alpha-glucosidase/alpha-galactosidase [Treponema sp.]